MKGWGVQVGSTTKCGPRVIHHPSVCAAWAQQQAPSSTSIGSSAPALLQRSSEPGAPVSFQGVKSRIPTGNHACSAQHKPSEGALSRFKRPHHSPQRPELTSVPVFKILVSALLRCISEEKQGQSIRDPLALPTPGAHRPSAHHADGLGDQDQETQVLLDPSPTMLEHVAEVPGPLKRDTLILKWGQEVPALRGGRRCDSEGVEKLDIRNSAQFPHTHSW